MEATDDPPAAPEAEYARLLALCQSEDADPGDYSHYAALAEWLRRGHSTTPGPGRDLFDGLTWCVDHRRRPQRVQLPAGPRPPARGGAVYWLWTYAGPGLAGVPGVPAAAKRPTAPCRVPEGCYPSCPEYELFRLFETAIRRAADFYPPPESVEADTPPMPGRE